MPMLASRRKLWIEKYCLPSSTDALFIGDEESDDGLDAETQAKEDERLEHTFQNLPFAQITCFQMSLISKDEEVEYFRAYKAAKSRSERVIMRAVAEMMVFRNPWECALFAQAGSNKERLSTIPVDDPLEITAPLAGSKRTVKDAGFDDPDKSGSPQSAQTAVEDQPLHANVEEKVKELNALLTRAQSDNEIKILESAKESIESMMERRGLIDKKVPEVGADVARLTQEVASHQSRIQGLKTKLTQENARRKGSEVGNERLRATIKVQAEDNLRLKEALLKLARAATFCRSEGHFVQTVTRATLPLEQEDFAALLEELVELGADRYPQLQAAANQP